MSSFPARPALSVRTRLMLAAGLCALLALLPTTLLATRYYAEFSDARREARALDEMRDWLAKTLPMFSNMQHYVCQKEVALDGDTADVRVYLMNPMQIAQPDGGTWQLDFGGYYLHKLVRTPDGWRIRELVEEFARKRTD